MDILLLTQENCHFCEMAKELLDRLALEYNFSISILELNSLEGQTLAEQNGILFPPGLLLMENLFPTADPPRANSGENCNDG